VLFVWLSCFTFDESLSVRRVRRCVTCIAFCIAAGGGEYRHCWAVRRSGATGLAAGSDPLAGDFRLIRCRPNIVSQRSNGVQIVALSLGGMAVLYAALLGTQDERIYQAAILRTLVLRHT